MSATTPDLTTLPTPISLTLLLKNAKSTTLLSLLPTSPISEIKTLLLAALQSRNVPSLPSSPASLELGVLINKRDPTKGWISLEERVSQLATKRGVNKGAGWEETMEAAGLVDGSWVAWRVRAEKMDGDGDAVVVDLGSDIEEEEDPGWDVEVPRYEDEEEG